MVVEISNMFDISPTLSDRRETMNDHVNNGPDPEKIPSYQPVSSS